MEEREKLHGAVLVPAPSEAELNQRQFFAYRDHRRDLIRWMHDRGKNLEQEIGYANTTVRNRAARLDKIYRWVWNREGYYTEDITPAHAEAYTRHLATSDYRLSYRADLQKCLKMLFRWQSWKRNTPVEWNPDIRFQDPTHNQQPRDFLTLKERKKIHAAALEYGSVPSYHNVSPEERSRYNTLLAERFGTPKHRVGPDEWARANNWKIPSIVWTSLDAGFRPIEVGRCRIQWLDLENGVLRIPMEESTKNRDNWTIGLREVTTKALQRWLMERDCREKYDDVDWVWLTWTGTRYSSSSLNHLFRKLCDEAGISREHWDITWFSIRRSTATYMAREEDLAAAAAQLRHKSTRTTMRYDQAPVEERQKALERMG